MKTTTTTLIARSVVAALSGCGEDVTTSDEYQELEQEVAVLEQELADATAEVVAVLDEWSAANGRNDGSVTDLYRLDGYHLDGDERIELDELGTHLGGGDGEPEWITEPLLIAAEPAGRYVVTRGLRNTIGNRTFASALTFEIMTNSDGELEIAQSDWTYEHS